LQRNQSWDLGHESTVSRSCVFTKCSWRTVRANQLSRKITNDPICNICTAFKWKRRGASPIGTAKSYIIRDVALWCRSLAWPRGEGIETYTKGVRDVDTLAEFEEDWGWIKNLGTLLVLPLICGENWEIIRYCLGFRYCWCCGCFWWERGGSCFGSNTGRSTGVAWGTRAGGCIAWSVGRKGCLLSRPNEVDTALETVSWHAGSKIRCSRGSHCFCIRDGT